jgi:hypothetical protein
MVRGQGPDGKGRVRGWSLGLAEARRASRWRSQGGGREVVALGLASGKQIPGSPPPGLCLGVLATMSSYSICLMVTKASDGLGSHLSLLLDEETVVGEEGRGGGRASSALPDPSGSRTPWWCARWTQS